MPNSASAAKRLRQNEKRRVRNKTRKTELKTLAKQVERAIHDGKKDDAERLFKRYTKRLDQATAKNVLHVNTAGRRKARFAPKIAALSA